LLTIGHSTEHQRKDIPGSFIPATAAWALGGTVHRVLAETLTHGVLGYQISRLCLPCVEALTAAIDAFVRAPEQSLAFVVLAFAKPVLHPIPRAGNRRQAQAGRVICARLQSWRTGQFHPLFSHETPSVSLRRRPKQTHLCEY